MTEIHVGSEEVEKFIVRKDLATRNSKLIGKTLDPTSDWKEAKENVVYLPEESLEAFQSFVTFLDTGVVHLDHFKSTKSEPARRVEWTQEKQWDSIAQAWLLGDRIDSVTLKDAVVEKVISLVRDSGKVPTSLHRPIFKGSVSRSGMRRLLTDIAVYSWFPGILVDQSGDPECADFFRDIGVESMNRAQSALQGQMLAVAPYDKQDVGYHYHDHETEGKPCYKTMFN
jgi:hypothetical protein